MEFNLKRFAKVGSQDYRVAELLVAGKTREEVIRHYFTWVGKREPFIFRENIGGGRRTKPQDEQWRLFLWQVNRTIGKMKAEGFDLSESYSERKKWSSKERHWVRWRQNYINELERELIDEPDKPAIPKPGDVSPVDPQGNPLGGGGNGVDLTPAQYDELFGKLQAESKVEIVEYSEDGTAIEWTEFDEEEEVAATWRLDENNNHVREPKLSKSEAKKIVEEEDDKPIVYKTPTRVELIDDFYKRMMLARDFVISREMGGEYLDFISTRAVKDGAKAIAYGLHPDEVMEAVTKTWSEDSRRELLRHERLWKAPKATIDIRKYDVPFAGAHEYLGYAIVLAHARIPIFLVGPSGCGKSFMARDLAEALEFEYGELPLTAGATPSWLVGAETISGYKSRPFVEIYGEGGVFCFEEMDAADPNMLLLVNNALANESFTNPVTGEEITKHKKFIAVATANTWGLGANRQYTGRERLDAATLDRWRVGRIEMNYDEKVEKAIIKNMKAIAEKREAKTKPKKAAAMGFK